MTVDGEPARFRFVRPTYPGDPRGPEDPDPRAHQASLQNPVGGPHENPLPPACALEMPSLQADPESEDGASCLANKLVITPARKIPRGERFTVEVAYEGKPGIRRTAVGFTEGWFRTRGGNTVLSEPLGSQVWMPLNDYPAAKPTYDFRVTTEPGKTVVANGTRESLEENPPSAAFPEGSATTADERG